MNKNGKAAYKVEILTATKKGLAAFLSNLEVVRGGRRSKGSGPFLRSHVAGGRNIPLLVSDGYSAAHPMSGPPGIALDIGSLNRDVIQSRVDAYRVDMDLGAWWFTPDPIVVTATGDIINGQHRLLAVEAALANGLKDKDAPQFVVVWGVDERAAILMDEARRSSVDRRDIAMRYAQSNAK